MIIQFECDGFKNLQDVALPLRPFQAFVGPNNVGKSNLFDALRLFSMLPDYELPDIMQSVRGDPFEVFTQLPDGSHAKTMRLAVELLLDDAFGDELEGDVNLTNTRLRYEIVLERDEGKASGGVRIAGERLVARAGDNSLPWDSSAAFREAYVQPPLHADRPYITTEGESRIIIHPDALPRSLRRSEGSPEARSPRSVRNGTRQSVLYAIRDAGDYPHISAVRNELRGWRFMRLDPDMMRGADSADGPDQLGGNGQHLAAAMHRILKDDEVADVEMSSWIGQIVPGARHIDVRYLEELHRYVVELTMRDGRRFSSRVLSDGTLRLLALLALRYDTEQGGCILFEEPENGVHPRGLGTMIELLKEMATNPDEDDIVPSDRLRQVLITTHSPALVDALNPSDLILVDEFTRMGEGPRLVRRVEYRPLLPPVRSRPDGHDDAVVRAQIRHLLERRELGDLWTDGVLGAVSAPDARRTP